MKKKDTRRDFIKKSALVGATFTIVPRYVLGKGFLNDFVETHRKNRSKSS